MSWNYVTLEMSWGRRTYRYMNILNCGYPEIVEYLNKAGCWESSKNINVRLRIKNLKEI